MTLFMKPITLRIWHWLNAIIIFCILGTVLLRKTFLSWRINQAVIQEKMMAAGVQIDPELAKNIAQTLRDRMWEWHYIFGYSLVTLFVFRVALLIFNKSTRPSFKGLDTHHKMVQYGYIFFYFMTLLMIASGFSMYFKDFFGLSKATVDFLKDRHETAMWFFVAFTAAHILGVIVAELRDEPGIVSRMINGNQKG